MFPHLPALVVVEVVALDHYPLGLLAIVDATLDRATSKLWKLLKSIRISGDLSRTRRMTASLLTCPLKKLRWTRQPFAAISTQTPPLPV